jgi:hypothetical protein
MESVRSISYFMMMLLIFGSFAPFVSAADGFISPTTSEGFASNSRDYGSTTNSWQGSQPSFGNYYSGSMDTYWPILTNLENDQCDAVSSDFVVMIPPGGCEPSVVRSDLLAEQNVPVFCQLSAIRVNPLIDVSTIKSISFKGDYPDEVAGISFHPARAAVKTQKTLLGDPIEENIGYVVIVLKKHPDERDLAEYVSGMLTATVRYDAHGAFGTGAGEYYLKESSDSEWEKDSAYSSFWGGKGYLRATNIDSDRATIEVMTDKDNVYRTLTLEEGETSQRIYYPGYYCTAALSVKLNKIDNSEDMAKIDIDGDVFWVRKGSKLLNGKCRVVDLNVFPAGGGEVEISCSGSSKFSLVMKDRGIVLNNGKDINVKIGGVIEADNKKYYLGYYGKLENGSGFAVMFDDAVSESEVSLITGVYDGASFADGKSVGDALENKKIFRSGGEFDVFVEGEDAKGGLSFVSSGSGLSEGKYVKDSNIPLYMGKLEGVVSNLADEFPAEKKLSDEYWGEEALLKAIDLAGVVENEEMQLRLIKNFLNEYPGSLSVEDIRSLKLDIERFSYEGSSMNVAVNGDNYDIRVDGFVSGNSENDNVNIKVGGSNLWEGLQKGEVYGIGENNNREKFVSEEDKKSVPRLEVLDIDGSGANFHYYWKDKVDGKDKPMNKRFSVKVGSYSKIGGVEFYVDAVNVREVAYVSLVPEVRNTKTEANFTFKIGIEKRAIELNPEVAKRKISNLNKSIAMWEDRVAKLGDMVRGMKAACFAVSTVLTVKSMADGFGSASTMARGDVMDYYEVVCKKETDGRAVNMQRCYSKYSGEIDSAIDVYGAGMMSVNERVSACTDGDKSISEGFFDSKVIDSEGYVAKLKDCDVVAEGWNDVVNKVPIERANLDDAQDIQAVMLEREVCGASPGSVACKMAREDMERELSDNVARIGAQEFAAESEDNYGVAIPAATNPNNDAVAQQTVSAKGTKISVKSEANYLAQVVDPDNANGRYIVEVDKNKEIVNVFTDNGGLLVPPKDMDKLKDEISKNYKFYIPASAGECTHEMVKPYVRYREENNKQGFVAVVPFDLKNGWYAYVDAGAYTDAGAVKNFWICNVGSDGLIDDGPTKDVCAMFTGSSKSHFTPCPGMSDGDVSKLYFKAEDAIREANRNGEGIKVDGQFVSKTTPLGAASAGVECTDFMSVEDCNMMFNVCDPVICPPSRCDMDGKFPVSDVISTGVVGSIALCLPNFGKPSEGGVLIPVCLSGIHAGLDAYVSILKSHKLCLEKSVESGQYVGICDEITAIYTCEFFWGQISPIFDTLVGKLAGSLYGSGSQVKGGAEYMNVGGSFANLDKSIDYFTSTYATGAFRAFDMRGTQEIGSTVCKGFVGTSLPTSAEGLDNLLDPESPVQFYASFSDNLFTDATVPSTSYYKVYYHIYAGNDAGTHYRVYLKSPPESSYYSSRQTISVGGGYIAKGEAVDEAIDLTAPSGYSELCVDINGREECGFESVTSDFGLNYASQLYVADQVDDRGISKTEDCVTTSASAWGMVDPNLQSGAERSIGGDDISSTGIVRICASANPDMGVLGGNDVYCDFNKEDRDSQCASGKSCVEADGDKGSGIGRCEGEDGNNQVSGGRWIDVGYCGDPSVRCWLDSTTVEDNLEEYMAVNDLSVDELTRESEDLQELNEQYKNVNDKLRLQREAIEGMGSVLTEKVLNKEALEIVTALDQVAGVEDGFMGQGSNNDKAEALALKASLYMKAVEELLKGNPGLKIVEQRVEVAESEECGNNCYESVDGRCMNDEHALKGECCCYEESGEGLESSSEKTGDESVKLPEEVSMESCQVANGEKIIEIVQGIKSDANGKYNDFDKLIKDEGVAENLECLVLMIAMKESSLTHWGTQKNGKVTECSEDVDGVSLIEGGSSEVGIMQINTGMHTAENSKSFDDFSYNVEYGVEDVLIDKYLLDVRNGRSATTYPREYLCSSSFGTEYGGWRAALRLYNGWNGDDGVCFTEDNKEIGDHDYVESVLGMRGVVEEMFPECGGVVSYADNDEVSNNMESDFSYNKELEGVSAGSWEEADETLLVFNSEDDSDAVYFGYDDFDEGLATSYTDGYSPVISENFFTASFLPLVSASSYSDEKCYDNFPVYVMDEKSADSDSFEVRVKGCYLEDERNFVSSFFNLWQSVEDTRIGEIRIESTNDVIYDKMNDAEGVFDDLNVDEGVFVSKFKDWKEGDIARRLYESINAAEMTGIRVDDQWIRTRASSKGSSTAYGPVQITKSLIDGYLRNGDINWTDEERRYLGRFVNQSWKFLAHGNVKNGVVDARTVGKYESVYEGLGIKIGDDYDSRYDYGGEGELGESEYDKGMYERIAMKILFDIYDEHDGDLDRTWREWRYGRGKIQASIDGESGYVDDRYLNEFREKAYLVALVGSAEAIA